MKNWQRQILAVLISTLSVIPVCLSVIYFIGGLDDSHNNALILVAPTVSFLSVLLIGLPVHAFLRHRKLSRPIYYAIPGFVAPALWVVFTRPLGNDAPQWIALQAVLLGVVGVIVALIFRWVALGGRPA